MAVLLMMLLAAACFLLAAFGFATADVGLVPLGLTRWVAAEAIDTWRARRG